MGTSLKIATLKLQPLKKNKVHTIDNSR